MITHYLKIALRHLWHNKITSLINIVGLSTGVASCLLIILYIQDEKSFDTHYSKADRIARLVRERQYPNRMEAYAKVGHSWAQSMQDEIPEIEAYCRLIKFDTESSFLKVSDKIFEEKNYFFVDSTFFELFDIEMISGDPKTALIAPEGIVLTESIAKKYFGNEDPLGKTIIDPQWTEYSYQITGVCKDFPPNSHFRADILLPISALLYLKSSLVYIQHNTYTYFLFKEKVDPKTIEAKFPPLVNKYSAGQVEEIYGVNYEEYQKQGNYYSYFLQPLKEIHLNSDLEEEIQINGSATLLNLLSLTALIILLIACINYLNLTTARMEERALEIGIRKTVGSSRNYIVIQFLTESILIGLLSTLIGLLLMLAFLPIFNQLTEKAYTFNYFLNPGYILAFFIFGFIIGGLAGIYPALILSSFKPITVLRGRLSRSQNGRWFRSILIIFQYTISIVLLICTLVVYLQQAYVNNKSLGFDKDQLLIIKPAALEPNKKLAFQNALESISQVNCVSSSISHVGGTFYGASLDKPGAKEPIIANEIITNHHYLECLGVSFLYGRDFSPNFKDSLSCIVNEITVKELGLPDNPIGQRIFVGKDKAYFTIVGVVKNFNYQSFYSSSKPLIIRPDLDGWSNFFLIRLTSGETDKVIEQIEKVWEEFLPGYPIDYRFQDDIWTELHKKGDLAKDIFLGFTFLAILLTCIGLFGLLQYMTQVRTKEIGIRKVFGASEIQIIQLFNKDFLRLALIATIFAWPIAWHLTREWLQNFAFHIDLSLWIFVLGAIVVLLITFLTVSFISIRAAWRNPAEVLRAE